MRIETVILIALTLGATGCASLLGTPPPTPAGWHRDAFHLAGERCWRGECRTRYGSGNSRVEVATRSREYGPHQIPGWDGETRVERAISSAGQGLIRSMGGVTDRVRIGLAARVVSEGGRDGWRLRCSEFWIEDQEIERDDDGADHVAETTRRSRGLHCDGVAPPDTGAVRWRFRAGIAPPLDSIAFLYDSLSSAASPAVSPAPPMILERLAADGLVAESYGVARESMPAAEVLTVGRRVSVTRAGGAPLAVFHHGVRTTLDTAPDASPDERRILRLLAIATAPWR